MNIASIRSRWAAVGAAVAVSLGAGGIGITHATISSGERAVFVPLDDPCRLASTRPAPDTVGPRTTGIGPEESYTLDGWGTEGDCTLPSDTAALALNVTAVNASQQTNLRFFPADAAVPATANLNPSPGAAPTPNSVNVNLDATGQFKVFNKFGVVEVVIDVMGYYEDHNHDDRYLDKNQDSEAAIDGDDNSTIISTGDLTLATVTVDTPTSGFVIVNSSVYAQATNGDTGARCAISTDSGLGSILQNQSIPSNSYATMAGTRGFQVNKAILLTPDEMTFNLVCDKFSGGDWNARDPQLTAVFIPDPDAFGFVIVPLAEEAGPEGIDD